MLYFVYYFLGFFFVLLIEGNSFFKTSPHAFLWLNDNFLFFLFFWFSAFFFVFINKFFCILSYESLIVPIVFLFLLCLNRGPRNRFTSILLKGHLVNYLRYLRIAQFAIFKNFCIICYCLSLRLLFLFLFLFQLFFLLFLIYGILIESLHHFGLCSCDLLWLFYLSCYFICHLPLVLNHFCEGSVTFIFIFILILLTRYFLNLFIVTNSLRWRQITSHPHILEQ